MQKLRILLFLLLISTCLQAQVKVGTNPTQINEGAVLEIESTTKGLLLPRVSLKANNIWGLDGTAVAGMAVYNMVNAGTGMNAVSPGYYCYDGTKWISLAATEWYLQADGTDAYGDKTNSIYRSGSVGIGTEGPDDLSVLDLMSSTKGFFVPRMTESQRNAIPVTVSQDGLLLYNTTEGCFNFWSGNDLEWKSTCGQLGKAVFTVNCDDVKVNGIYIQGKELNSSHYLTIPVNVTKEGSYTFMGTTNNGYNFYYSGVFLSKDVKTIQIAGQGTPNTIQTDGVQLQMNGSAAVDCTPPIQIEVISPAGSYTMNCSSAKVNGVYKVGNALNSSNTITLPVNVTNLGSWIIGSQVEGGISFTGAGTFTVLGPQNLTLSGNGTPLTTDTKLMVLTSNSIGDVIINCSVNVIMTIPKKKLLTIGLNAAYGYNFSTPNTASNKLITTVSNFGTIPSSVVKTEGFNIIDGGNAPNVFSLLSQNPDIIVIGYSWNPSTSDAQQLATYLSEGGVLLAFCESTVGMQALFRAVFNNNNITTGLVNAAGALYSLPLNNDGILNGSFGDIRGKVYGEDASATAYAVNIPVSEVEVYAGDADLSQTNPGGTIGRVVAFKHKTLNFIWFGDGGFNSNETGSSNVISPFKLDGNNYPTTKPNYGVGPNKYSVVNAVFTANALEWALKQAEFSGINSKK